MEKYILWVTIASVVLLLVEIALGRHRGIYQKGDYAVLIIGTVAGRLVMVPLATLLVSGTWALLAPSLQGALGGVSTGVAYLPLLALTEFCFYWVHRWAHQARGGRNQLLWKIHRTHHAGKYMNVAVTKRLNLFWYFILPTSWVNGLAIYLGLVEAALAVTETQMFWNLITHSHFRWDDPIRRNRWTGPAFRALEHVFISPGMHHTHHGYGKDGAMYRNYALCLALWDWAFGTLHIPHGRPWKYGVPGPNPHWLEELAYPLFDMSNKEAPAEPEAGTQHIANVEQS